MNKNINYEKILESIIAFSTETNFYKLLDIVLTKMREITNCEAGTLYVLRDDKLYFTIVHNEKLGIFTYEEDTNIPPVDLNHNRQLESIENVCAYCAIKNQMVNIGDVYENAEFNFQGPRKYDAMTGFRTQSMLVFPLSDLNGNIIGVIQLLNSRGISDSDSGKIVPFDKDWEQTIWSLSHISAIALMNVRYMAEIKELFNSFVRIMTAAIDERTPYNANHTINVAEYTRKFIQYLRGQFDPDSPYHMDENREEQLIMAAFLHDIGKVVTPIEVMDKESRLSGRLPLIIQRLEIAKLYEKVKFLSGQITQDEYNSQIEFLNDTRIFIERINTAGFLNDGDLERVKTLSKIVYTDEDGNTVPVLDDSAIECLSIRKGTLTDAERNIMQEHVSVTERLLNNIKFNAQYENVPAWAKSHHELIDGKGYPHKKIGSQIPLEVRILTMMDIYDALTANDRPYKRVTPHETALKILYSMVDEGKLDGNIVKLFAESGIQTK